MGGACGPVGGDSDRRCVGDAAGAAGGAAGAEQARRAERAGRAGSGGTGKAGREHLGTWTLWISQDILTYQDLSDLSWSSGP